MKPCFFSAATVFLWLTYSVCYCADSPGLTITPDMQFSYAMTLFDDQDYDTAHVEFKRFLHFFPDDPRAAQAQFKCAHALYLSGRFQEAAQSFDRIIRQNREADSVDQITREAYFMQSKAFLNMGNPGYAQLVIHNFLKLTHDQDTRDRILNELSQISIAQAAMPGANTLDQAEGYLMNISKKNQGRYDTRRQLNAIGKARDVATKSPFLSGLASIIPGGGFLYCKRYEDALITFCLNTALIYAAYDSFHNENYAIGGIISFVEVGFYSGNIYGAITSAHKYNHARRIEVLEREFSFKSGFAPHDGGAYQFSLNYNF